MSGHEKMAAWKAHYIRTLCGVQLAARSIHSMPLGSVAQRDARADALTEGLRVMRMGEWRPVFPYTARACNLR